MMINSKVANVIRHREYVADILGSTKSFNPTFFPINPGLPATFPWLSPIASQFTAYRIRGMIFEFKSLASEYTANTYMGYVAMSTQYNSLAPPYADKKTMENAEYANSCKPSVDLYHPIESAPNQVVLSELYVRNTEVVQGDQRMYDLGELCVATGGQTVDGILGELWCTYEIEFYQARSDEASGAQIRFCESRGEDGSIAKPFDGAESISSNIDVVYGDDTISWDNSLSNGTFLLYFANSRGAEEPENVPIPTFTFTNMSLQAKMPVPNTSDPTGKWSILMVVMVNGPSPSIKFAPGAFWLTGPWRFMFTQVSKDFTLDPLPIPPGLKSSRFIPDYPPKRETESLGERSEETQRLVDLLYSAANCLQISPAANTSAELGTQDTKK